MDAVAVIAAGADLSLAAPLPDALPPGAPVTVLVHGYRYAPGRAGHDPHATLFAAGAWPRRLGFRAAAQGLCLGFGWQANGSLRQAHAEAGRAAVALAALVRRLRERGAGPVGFLAHSLGSRVVLSALPLLEAGDAGRIVLLSGAEFCGPATAALTTQAGRAAEVLNVTSRENDPFDWAVEWLVGRGADDRGPALGAGLSLPNAVTLQIDGAGHREGLRRLGYPVAGPARLVCHWSTYTRPGLFPLYRAFLHRPAQLPLGLLRAALPEACAPRWSRLVPRLPMLPGGGAARGAG
ncbi:MAG TPA: alpha/beta hydrolase [Paracoccaceae bacterium]|nr:alpha/beta hydrolase [Paracoccaceae bacterium]HMO72915.1 alpha/beta hydrolase [Paracoccaceae bacterium]